MQETIYSIISKTRELEAELKETGLWQKNIPVWVDSFHESHINTITDFAEWLQFVFIPNHLLNANFKTGVHKEFLVPHALKYFGGDVHKGKLLRILIEIDSLL